MARVEDPVMPNGARGSEGTRMWRVIAVGVLVASGAARAQAGSPSPDAGTSSDLTGTPQKPATKKSAPAAGAPDGGTVDRPSEDDLFGTSGGETPEPSGAERPSEDSLFGDEPQPPAAEAAETTRGGGVDDEARRLRPGIEDRFAAGEAEDDPLAIGGFFYQRAALTNRRSTSFAGTTLTAPTLVDAYFDARPNDRLRAMIVARMNYDPTIPSGAAAAAGAGPATPSGDAGSGSTTATLASLFRPPNNPNVLLDQLWLRFDVARVAFLTLGKQHVKWGAGRFWNPTDFLHPVRRDALALFDERTGVNMIRVHVPMESTGANFYALALLDNFGSAETLGDVGGAFRAEIVLGDAEIGADAVVQRGLQPRYGVDASSALGPLDVYVEAALETGPYSRVELRTLPSDPAGRPRYGIVRERAGEHAFAATGGLTWTFAYTENDTATIGAEYFYNPTGYDDPQHYPALLFAGEFQPFYIGQHYAGLFAVVAAPGSWDKTSFVLSTLGNLSDRSFVSRFDFTVRVLTHLTVEANASVFYGAENGEFRLGLEIPESSVNGVPIPAISLPPQQLQLGIGLRVDI